MELFLALGRFQHQRRKEGRMTTAVARKREHKTVVGAEPSVSKALQDRIAADGEQVVHTLDPDREPDLVRYPDPQAPHARDDGQALAPQWNAEIQMARRTDAGPEEAVSNVTSADRSTLLLWGAGAAGLFLVFGVLIALY